MNNLSQFGFGGRIKSIQRGIIPLPSPDSFDPSTQVATATITPVNTSKSILYYLGVKNGRTIYSLGGGSTESSVQAMIELTNSTTITATIGFNYGNSPSISNTIPPTVSWQLVEYYWGKKCLFITHKLTKKISA